MNNTKQQEILNTLVQRLIVLGWDQTTVAERAQGMIDLWDYFTDNAVDDCGQPTYLDWIDPEVVKLLDETLNIKYGIHHA
jgi:hypothetical protein